MMPSGPLVSIVIPTHNRAGYLVEAIESVLAQDYPRLELIVIDDGSTDETAQVLERYEGRCRIERRSNAGQPASVNHGWELAQGEILGFLGDDDVLAAGAVTRLVGVLEAHPEAVMAYSDYSLIGSDSRVMRRISMFSRPFAEAVRDLRVTPGPGALQRRDAVRKAGPWDTALRLTPDLDFYLRLGLTGPFIHVAENLAAFRVHHGSTSFRQSDSRLADEPLRVARRFFARDDLPDDVRKAAPSALAFAAIAAARAHQRDGRPREALRALGIARRSRARALLTWYGMRLIVSSFINRAVYRVLGARARPGSAS
jgi:glycosyltransferase involved in cell wall biosynthesis